MTDLFRNVLSCEVLAVFVMAAVIFARLVLRKLPKRLTILLWLIVCLRLLVPVRLEAPVSLVPEPASDLSSEVQHISASGELSSLSREFSLELRPHYVFASNRDKAYTARQWGSLALDLSPYFWILGAAGLFLAQLRKLYRLRKRLADAAEISPGVYVSNRISGAFVLGLFRPDIYLPEGLGEEAQRFVLLHERTHIKRYDHVWKLLAYFCVCLHWFDPLVWVCFALFCRDVELACDEAVTAALSDSARCDYAETLLRLSGENPLFPLPAFSEPEPATRIKRVLSWKKPAETLCALVLVLAIVFGVGLLVNPYPKEAIFDQRYQVGKSLYEAPQFDYSYRADDYPFYVLTKDHVLYAREPGQGFAECGALQEVNFSREECLRLIQHGGLTAEGTYDALSRVNTCWLLNKPKGMYSFYLVMQAKQEVFLIIGAGDWGTADAEARYLFQLRRTEQAYDWRDMKVELRKRHIDLDTDTPSWSSNYTSETLPGLTISSFTGTKDGAAATVVAVFEDLKNHLGCRLRDAWIPEGGHDFASQTVTYPDIGKTLSIVTASPDRTDLYEVRAEWGGVTQSKNVIYHQSILVVFEWPDKFSTAAYDDTFPDIRFYDYDGNELPRN